MRENATAIDVGNQDHRAIDGFGKTHVGDVPVAHVGDVPVAQIDLGRAAGTFDEQALVLSTEALPRFKYRLHGAWLIGVVVARIEVKQCLAVDDHLRALVGRRFEQHRIEVGVRRQAGSECL